MAIMKGAARLLLILLVALLSCVTARPGDMLDFDWNAIEPSTTLNYTSCYEDFKCARLLAPLDWLNLAETADQVTIAILTLPASVDHNDPSFGGTIVVNPGGPGGSGTNFVYRDGRFVQNTASAGTKKYEVLGFDPRGVGFSTPNSNCHRDEFSRAAAVLEQRAIGPMDKSTDSVRRNMALARGNGRMCEADEQTTQIRKFMSTTSVVRDMVRIVDVLEDRHRANTNVGQQSDEVDDGYPDVELRSSRDTTARINYWGISYGTVLGRYFAAMYPGRIRRMVLEGVEDVRDYYNGSWAMNLPDTNKIQDHLWETCFEAAQNCDLYKTTDRDPEDIRDRVLSFAQELQLSPATFADENGYTFIDRSDIFGRIFRAMYDPQAAFPQLATNIAAAMGGNYSQLYSSLPYPKLDQGCSAAPPSYPYEYTWTTDAMGAIYCGDAPPLTGILVEEFEEYIHRLSDDAPEYASIWATLRLRCTGWTIRPDDRFSGPWTTPEHDPSLVQGLPAAPILFTSSLLDPVTPLSNARLATADHPGSAILVQDNAGHGSLTSPSRCRDEWISRYFDTGEVPPEETMCKSDCLPFKECPQLDDVASAFRKPGLLQEPWMPLGLNV